jgi:tRNA (cytidine32/uridine32-2'-O)-methyltransferase
MRRGPRLYQPRQVPTETLERMDIDLRIVLVGTSHPGNIGAAARAMKTMGLDRLVLVAPEAQFPHREAVAMAAGAEDLLESAQVVATLDDALADCVTAFGCTARRRSVALPEHDPRAGAAALRAAAARGPVALLFGRERTGLSNEELQRCHAAIHIPANPEYSSLNLAAAVQVLSYELRMASLAAEPVAAPGPDPDAEPVATQAQLEGFFGHLDQALHDIDFHKGRAPDIVMQRLRRLVLRATPDARELRILHGILADAQRMARLAREAGKA